MSEKSRTGRMGQSRKAEREKERGERERNKSPAGLGCCSRRRPRCQVSLFIIVRQPLFASEKEKKINLAIFPVEFRTCVRDTLGTSSAMM